MNRFCGIGHHGGAISYEIARCDRDAADIYVRQRIAQFCQNGDPLLVARFFLPRIGVDIIGRPAGRDKTGISGAVFHAFGTFPIPPFVTFRALSQALFHKVGRKLHHAVFRDVATGFG